MHFALFAIPGRYSLVNIQANTLRKGLYTAKISSYQINFQRSAWATKHFEQLSSLQHIRHEWDDNGH